jgi:hypothetical protein
MMWKGSLAILCVAAACHSSETKAVDARLCDALEISHQTAVALLDQAAQEYVGIGAAMKLWEEGQRMPPGSDGTGKYIDAGARARGHREAADSLCQSANAVNDEMRELVRLAHDSELQSHWHDFANIDCKLKTDPVTSVKNQSEVQIEWTAVRNNILDVGQKSLDVCEARFATKPAATRSTPFSLVIE